MAGMLAGVESARRRRIHQNIVCSSSQSSPSTGGASLCLRRSLFFPSSSPSSPCLGRSRTNQGQVDEKLGQLARQAKKRLDERLHAQSKSHPPRNNADEVRVESGGGSAKKKKKKGWGASAMARLGGMKTEKESECVICLEEMRKEEEMVKLECSHTFHMQCVIPWLQSHSICPCCRTPTSFS